MSNIAEFHFMSILLFVIQPNQDMSSYLEYRFARIDRLDSRTCSFKIKWRGVQQGGPLQETFRKIS